MSPKDRLKIALAAKLKRTSIFNFVLLRCKWNFLIAKITGSIAPIHFFKALQWMIYIFDINNKCRLTQRKWIIWQKRCAGSFKRNCKGKILSNRVLSRCAEKISPGVKGNWLTAASPLMFESQDIIAIYPCYSVISSN